MITALHNVINDAVKVNHVANKLIFIEPEADARLKRVEFSLTSFLRLEGGKVKNAVVIQADQTGEQLKQFTHFLDSECAHVNKKCDYIIFHTCANKLRVVLCELKSSLEAVGTPEARCFKQLDFSKHFVEYIVGIANAYCNEYQGIYTKPTEVEIHKLVLIPLQNVANALPLGAAPLQANAQQLNFKLNNGVFLLFLPTSRQGVAVLNWQQFMEAIINQEDN